MLKSSWQKSYSKNENGNTLIITLFVLVLITILGLSLVTMTTNTLKVSTNERTDQAVFYIAEAGLVERKASLTIEINNAYSAAVDEYKKQLIENSKKDPSEQEVISFKNIFKPILLANVSLAGATYNNFEKHFSKEPKAEVTIEQEEQDTKMIYTITSTGILGDLDTASRVITQKVSVDLNSASFDGNTSKGNYAVYARNKIEYAYHGIKDSVVGNIASATYDHVISPGPQIPLIHDPVNFDTLLNTKYREQLDFPIDDFKNASYYPNDSDLIANNSLIENGEWEKFNNKTLLLSNNLKLSTFSINNGGITFNIDVGDSDKILYVNKLKLNGHINIRGAGKLTIFVEDSMEFNNTYLNQNASPNKLEIYYAGNSKLNITNNTFLNTNMYMKQADIHYQGGGGFSGSLYSNGVGKITLTGGTFNESVNFIVPNYSFKMAGGSTVKGFIICDNLYLEGGASIIGKGSNDFDDSISIEQSSPIKNDPIVEQ
ncbi:pilus assembly PilX N-terminal domain-containing protein [Lysinibacillus sp. NPDC097287]|uniref:pilus assembly PilX N-terminal domain-containing protein n=1 Tax=Lysinibacillus sp. NPDC097287 TaxID=3364144 RepID=UPI0037FB7CBA